MNESEENKHIMEEKSGASLDTTQDLINTMNTDILEKKNHKIDAELSLDEKLKKGWKKENMTAHINWKKQNITVLKKHIDGSSPNAFVREYIADENMPTSLVWEQLFNRYAVQNLIEKGELDIQKIPSLKDMETLKNIRWGVDQILCPGYLVTGENQFYEVGTRTGCWLVDGSSLAINIDNMDRYENQHSGGFSLRLKK